MQTQAFWKAKICAYFCVIDNAPPSQLHSANRESGSRNTANLYTVRFENTANNPTQNYKLMLLQISEIFFLITRQFNLQNL